MSTRHLDLAPGRFERWWDKFHADHPGVQLSFSGGAAVLTSTNGSVATFTGWYPVNPGDDAKAALLRMPDQAGIILLRRGGYSIGLARGTKLIEHKTGTRYVQSRTAAGGWSQQRFARRRDNQAAELVGACADTAARILEPLTRSESAGLAIGGDDLLIADLLADPRLSPLTNLPRRTLGNIPDPRFAVLTQALQRANSVSVAVHNP